MAMPISFTLWGHGRMKYPPAPRARAQPDHWLPFPAVGPPFPLFPIRLSNAILAANLFFFWVFFLSHGSPQIPTSQKTTTEHGLSDHSFACRGGRRRTRTRVARKIPRVSHALRRPRSAPGASFMFGFLMGITCWRPCGNGVFHPLSSHPNRMSFFSPPVVASFASILIAYIMITSKRLHDLVGA